MSLTEYKVYVPDRTEPYTFTTDDVDYIHGLLLANDVVTEANPRTVEGSVIRYARPAAGEKGR